MVFLAKLILINYHLKQQPSDFNQLCAYCINKGTTAKAQIQSIHPLSGCSQQYMAMKFSLNMGVYGEILLKYKSGSLV